jgi:RAB protein geranylgeranyltransferase component A
LISWVEQHHHQQQQPQKGCRRGYNYHPNTLNVPTEDANNTTTTVHPKGALATLHIHSYRQSWTQEEVRQSRKFVLDLMPRVLFANGPAVSGLISSSVSSYVEFMAVQGLFLVTDTTLQAVPSSKSQVFQSTLLSPIEKRKLMKLLQLVLEYGELTSSTGHHNQSIPHPTEVKATTATATTTTNTKDTAATLATATSTNTAGSSIIDTINERNVQELGMSLLRPQNKPMNKSSLDQLLALATTSSSSSSQPSLQDYLQSQFQIPTSSFLSQVILHALCLQHSTQQYLPVTKGIDTLVRHVSSLGKYVDTTSLTTSTAFIAPLYGISELVQGFCRSCAVHGGVYMLRTTMESIRYGGSPSSNNSIMVSGTILTQGAEESIDKDATAHPAVVQFPISCKHVVVPQDAMLLPYDDETSANSTTTKILRRTCVIRGTLQLPYQQQRSIAIIPPLTQGISNSNAIFILILDASLNLCPVGYTVLHLSTSLVTASLDHGNEDEITNNSIQSLDKVMEYLLNICSAAPSTAKTQLSSLTDNDSKSCTEEQVPSPSQNAPQEILQVTFSISANDDKLLKYGRGSTKREGNQQVRGLHICKRQHLAITVDEAFEEAERIFHDIMNDTETDIASPPKFLRMSHEVRQQVMKNVISIRNDDTVDDDEKDILTSAMDLIGSPNLVEHSNMDQQVDSNIIIPFE